LPLVLVIEKGLFAAAHKSAIAQVFGRRHDRPIHAAWRPASEKRQGTKSREGTAVVPRALWGFCRGLKRMSFEGQLRRERCCGVT